MFHFSYKGQLAIIIHPNTVNILCLNNWKLTELKCFLILYDKEKTIS